MIRVGEREKEESEKIFKGCEEGKRKVEER